MSMSRLNIAKLSHLKNEKDFPFCKAVLKVKYIKVRV